MAFNLRDLTLAILGKDKTKDATDSAAQNFDKLTKKVADTNTGFKDFESALGNLAVPAAVAFGAVAAGATLAVDSASRLEQSVGGVDAVFKAQAATMHEWAEAADNSLGLSENAYNEFATVIGSQLKNAGVPMDELAGKTDDLISLGSDLSAMYGGTAAEAVAALSSALKGEMDPMERYGATLTAAAVKAKALSMGLVENAVDADKVAVANDRLTLAQNNYNEALAKYGPESDKTLQASVALQSAQMGLDKAVEGTVPELDSAARAAATMALIYAQTTDAQGTFAREADTLASKQAKASAEFENMRATIGERLLPVAARLTSWASGAIGWMTEHQGLTVGLGGAIAFFAGTILALNAALKVYNTIKAVSTLLTKAQTTATWELTAAMLASPTTWIVLGIMALVAAIVWVATKTTWFQTIWEHVWGFLKAVGAWFAGPFVDFFRGPIGFIVGYFQFWGSIVLWLWDNILSPVFGLIGAVFRMVWELSIKPVIDFIVAYFQLWAGVVLWLWDTVFQPTFQFIGDVVLWLWSSVIEPYIGFIAGIFLWLWDHAVKPAVDFIVAYVQFLGGIVLWLWDHAVKPAVDFIVGYVANLVAGWKSGVERVTGYINTFTDKVKSAREWVGDQIGKIVDFFQGMPGKIGGFLSGIKDTIVNAFKGGFSWISDKFNSLISGANTVIGALNKIPGVNVPLIPHIPKFHSGGIFRAPAGMSEGLAILRDGEKILTPDQARDGGGGDTFNVSLNVSLSDVEDIERLIVWLRNLRNNTRRGLVVAS